MTHRAHKLHVCAVGFFVIGKENSFDTLDELQIGRACIAVVVGCAYFFLKALKSTFVGVMEKLRLYIKSQAAY